MSGIASPLNSNMFFVLSGFGEAMLDVSTVGTGDIAEQTAAQIATLTATAKPGYSIDGQAIDWSEHLTTLFRVLEVRRSYSDEGSYEVQSEGYG